MNMLIVCRLPLNTILLVNVKMATVEMEGIAQVSQGFHNGYFNDFPLYNADINECATNMTHCVENSTCVNTNGSYYCVCNCGYGCEEEDHTCKGNNSFRKLNFWLMYHNFVLQILMSVLWTYTTVPKAILNVSTLLVVIIASVCQATRASSVKKVMAVFYTVYFFT